MDLDFAEIGCDQVYIRKKIVISLKLKTLYIAINVIN